MRHRNTRNKNVNTAIKHTADSINRMAADYLPGYLGYTAVLAKLGSRLRGKSFPAMPGTSRVGTRAHA
jgi:hypothetical protein